jgi:hypothetical protein
LVGSPALDALALQIGDGGIDVIDQETDVVPADVAVLG